MLYLKMSFNVLPDKKKEFESHLRSERFRALWGGMKLLGKITEAKIVTSDKVEELSLAH
jgi:hypothetical protein